MQDIPYILSHSGKNRPLRNLQAPEEGPPGLQRVEKVFSPRCSIFQSFKKALKNGDHHRAGHPSRGSRAHPSAPLTKGSHFFDRLTGRKSSTSGLFLDGQGLPLFSTVAFGLLKRREAHRQQQLPFP